MIYRIEIRFDADCESDEEAKTVAQEKANTLGGEVTAIFDEDFEELG